MMLDYWIGSVEYKSSENFNFIFRAGIMYMSNDGEVGQQMRLNMFSLSGTGFFGAMGRSLNLGGQTALALRLLLAAFSSKLSSDMNRPFGDEFRAARKASEEVGAQVVLGDRPIEITLERAWNSLKWNEKLSLVLSVVRGITSSADMSRNNLKESSTDDSTFQLYEQLSFSYPSLLQPLLHERDTMVGSLEVKEEKKKAVLEIERVAMRDLEHLDGCVNTMIMSSGMLHHGSCRHGRHDILSGVSCMQQVQDWSRWSCRHRGDRKATLTKP
ncbi:hypothetical protein TEA_009279 [Camellia sinensis var. sinensis]|uniref:Uncharacterized protein n=1 Tax=Camellia sinensis var. sinensis TaxID=542762 RepID=A0A4S4EU27_CAMSN|nr:hypothetical protein TEA_009279 [Camellia sinensis var. sinensis]